ncbi:MAG: sensor domain-containing diguanylate cyclase [Synergistaceae bacterium]|jgi:diguanylate cyclase (GGDEF)-like protein/PAS domain S-box-containing protein|nr:sensor domain-containing diguanylate cyclase [Synergistaceae bacterium]
MEKSEKSVGNGSGKHDMELLVHHKLLTWDFVVKIATCAAALVVLASAAALTLHADGRTYMFFLAFAAILLAHFTLLVRERERLKVATLQLTILAETTGGCCWKWDVQTGRIRLSPEGSAVFGRNVETLDELSELTHPDDRHIFWQIAQDAAKTSSFPDFNVEFRMQSVKGDWRWFAVRNSATGRHALKGTVLTLVGSFLDIDDYKRAVDAMRDSEKRLETIFKSAPGAMAVTDGKGSLLEANQAFHDVLGYSPGELQGIPILSLAKNRRDREGADLIGEALQERGGGDARQIEERFVRRGGEDIVLNYGLSRIYDFDGNVQNYIFSGVDVTLQKERTLKLQQLHFLVHSLLRTQQRDHLVEGMLEYLKSTVANSTCAVYRSVEDKPRDKKVRLERVAWYETDDVTIPDCAMVEQAVASKAPFMERGPSGLATRVVSPLIFQSRSVGALDLRKPEGLQPSELETHQLLVDYVSGFWVLYDILAIREEEAFIDPLTGIWNRRYMLRRMQEESERVLRYGGNVCLAMGDMGNFKHTNDNYGHAKGDEVLIKTAAVIRRNLRQTDSVGRYGGDEFVLLLPNISEKAADMVLGRIKQELVSLDIRGDDADPQSLAIKVVLDFGVSFFSSECPGTLADAINKADEAMYANKQARKAKAAEAGQPERRE